MASRAVLPRLLRGAVGLLALLFVVAGLATSGLPGALTMAGLALLLVGIGAAVTGRARWAFIASRKVATGVAAAGVVALIVGGATAPPTAAALPTPPPAAPAARRSSPRPRGRR